MNMLLLSAATLLCLVSVAHSYLGERHILIRLFRGSDLPRLFGSDDFTKRSLRLAWHVTSVLGGGLATLLMVLACSPLSLTDRELIHVIAVTSALSGLVALAVSRGRHLSWLAFIAIAGLTWCGA